MNELVSNVGKRIRAARKAAGYRSATAFSKDKSIPLSTYSQHENGRRVLSIDILIQYADLFHVSAAWLLTGDGEPFDLHENVQRRAVIDDELYQMKPGSSDDVLPETISPIQTDVGVIDMSLYKEVLLHIAPLFRDDSLDITERELIDFSIEVYNGIVITTAGEQDKLAMIDLSIASLKRGVAKSNNVGEDRRSA
jgi:transcriptional regulator with XRE-family HTH domain